MSITTKIGDDGTTRLFSGETVEKSSARPDAYGDIDELVSVLSVARESGVGDSVRTALLGIQELLFVAGSEIATHPEKLDRLPRRIDEQSIVDLEEKLAMLESEISLPVSFIVPGSTLASAHIHHARTIARRCERKVSALNREKLISNAQLLVWFNRLSDYLYLLALCEESDLIVVKDGRIS